MAATISASWTFVTTMCIGTEPGSARSSGKRLATGLEAP
jgi:hypothetical protein